MRRKILLAALAIAGVSSTLLPDQAVALPAMNGLSLGNGVVFGNGVIFGNGLKLSNGADLGGLSLEGVILPEDAAE